MNVTGSMFMHELPTWFVGRRGCWDNEVQPQQPHPKPQQRKLQGNYRLKAEYRVVSRTYRHVLDKPRYVLYSAQIVP